MSDRKLRFTAEARSDFRSILRYSRDTWGVRQRDAYAARLTAAMHRLLAFPNLGQAREDLSPGLRGLAVEEHVVYYRVGARSVTITRILYGNMDATAQFIP